MPPQGTVLVVDDNAANRALAQATLEDEGYVVHEADSGQAALAAFAEHGADCVLLDVRMPGMDGFEVARRLRELAGEELGIVFLTALRDVDTFDAAQRAGGDDFLTKPVRPTELLSRVQSAVKLSRLSSEVREQHDALRDQRNDLVRLQLQKDRLMAYIVHDLKNPVNALDLHAQLLQRDAGLSDRSRRSVRYIRSEVANLTRLVLNLLDLSKRDEGGLVPKVEALDLAAFVGALLEVHQARAVDNEVTLAAALDVEQVDADPDLLRRVLDNLLDNAITHAPAETAVVVSARVGEAGVELRVADRGSGIPDALRDRIFEPHFRIQDDGLASRTGRGLGLAFCRAAIVAHGGTIFVEPTEVGTTFCIQLPAP